MKLSILALAAMIVVAGAADSRRLLQNPLDLLVGGKEFPKLGKNDKSPSPPPPAPGIPSLQLTTSPPSPPPPPPTQDSGKKLDKEICKIPDLTDYQEIEGCQCECVITWETKDGPTSIIPSKKTLFKHKVLPDLSNFGFEALEKEGSSGRKLLGNVWDLAKNQSSDFWCKWPKELWHDNCIEPKPLITDQFKQCKCKCPVSQPPPPPAYVQPLTVSAPTESWTPTPTQSWTPQPTESWTAPPVQSFTTNPTDSWTAPPNESWTAPPTDSWTPPPTESWTAPPSKSWTAPSTESWPPHPEDKWSHKPTSQPTPWPQTEAQTPQSGTSKP